MPAIVTNKFRIHNAKQFVEAFDEVTYTSGAAITDASGLLNTHMYLFIGKVTAWADDTAPPTPTDSVSNTVYNHWRDMIAAKKIGSTDISHVAPRYNWTTGTNYFAYLHSNNALFDQQFYVMTDDYNVYKCLSNNNTDGASTTKPTGTGTAIVSTGDGYKWKFLYQISAARALKFVTPSYIPTQRVRKANLAIANTTDSSFQYAVEIAANTSGNGAIEVVHVTSGGSNYRFETGSLATFTETTTTAKIAGTNNDADGNIIGSDIYFTSGDQSGKGGTITAYVHSTKVVTWGPATSAAPATGDTYSIGPKVTITGDGHGANVRATNTASGVLGDIVVVAGGNSYGNAVATVTTTSGVGTQGSGAALVPVVGPRGGHGDDAIEELGAFFVMVNSRLEYGESGNFTTNNDFRKIGLVAQPLFANGDVATSSTIDQCVTVTIQSWNSTAYAEDETVTGALSGATGKVVDFKSNTTLRLVDVTTGTGTTTGYDGIAGSFRANEVLAGASASANSSAVAGGDLKKFSGDVLYVENRSPVTRADDQIEDVKLIIEF